MEYPNPLSCDQGTPGRGRSEIMTVVHLDDVTTYGANPAAIMDKVVEEDAVPEDKQVRHRTQDLLSSVSVMN